MTRQSSENILAPNLNILIGRVLLPVLFSAVNARSRPLNVQEQECRTNMPRWLSKSEKGTLNSVRKTISTDGAWTMIVLSVNNK